MSDIIDTVIPLSETTKFIVDNRGKTAPTEKIGIPLIATNCINNQYLYPLYLNVRYVSQETYNNWFRSHPEPGDIILTLKGSQNGAVCFVPDPVDFVIAQDMVALRANEDVIDPLFLFAALRLPDVQTQIKNLDVSGVIPHFKKTDFDKLLLPYPERKLQEFIGKLYFSLFKKIHLLQCQNKTLESMAETLFRQWFVEEADEGWEEKGLEELCTITRGASPRPIVKYVINGTVPWIKIADGSRSSSFFIDSTNEFIIEEGVSKSVKVFPGDLILSNSATCGFPYFVELEGCIHDGWLLFRDFKGISKYFVFFFLKQIFRELNNIADGSVQNNLNTGILKKYSAKVPPDYLINEFDDQVGFLINKIKSNIYQIRTLERFRDMLLPKLMNGEVKVEI